MFQVENTDSLDAVIRYYHGFDKLYGQNYLMRWDNFMKSTDKLKSDIQKYRSIRKNKDKTIFQTLSINNITKWFMEFLFIMDYRNFLSSGEVCDSYFEQLVKEVTNEDNFIHPNFTGEFDCNFPGKSGENCRLSCLSSNFFLDVGEKTIESSKNKKRRKECEGYVLRIGDVRDRLHCSIRDLSENHETVQRMLFEAINKSFNYNKHYSEYGVEMFIIPPMMFENMDRMILNRKYSKYSPSSFIKDAPLLDSSSTTSRDVKRMSLRNSSAVKTIENLSTPAQQPLKKRRTIQDDDDDNNNSLSPNLNLVKSAATSVTPFSNALSSNDASKQKSSPSIEVVVTSTTRKDNIKKNADSPSIVEPFAAISPTTDSPSPPIIEDNNITDDSPSIGKESVVESFAATSTTTDSPSSLILKDNNITDDSPSIGKELESFAATSTTTDSPSSLILKDNNITDDSPSIGKESVVEFFAATSPTTDSPSPPIIEDNNITDDSPSALTKSIEFIKKSNPSDESIPLENYEQQEQSSELIWKSGYKSATLNKYIGFHDSFLQSVVLDLNNVFIQITNSNRQIKNILSHFLLCPTYSSYVWYNYLMHLWNNNTIEDSLFEKKKSWKKSEFLQHTGCTILYLFFTITEDDYNKKIIYQKEQNKVSLFQLLVETRLIFIKTKVIANCINVLSYLCKKKIFYEDKNKILPFEELFQKKNYEKQIKDGKENVVVMLNLDTEWTTSSLLTYFSNEVQIEKAKRKSDRLQNLEASVKDDFVVGKKKRTKKRKVSKIQTDITDDEESNDDGVKDQAKEEKLNEDEKKKKDQAEENKNDQAEEDKKEDLLARQSLLQYYSEDTLKADPLFAKSQNNILYSSMDKFKNPQPNTQNALKINELSKSFDQFLETPNSPFQEGKCDGFLHFRLFSSLFDKEWLNDNVNTAYAVMLSHRERLLRKIYPSRPKILYIDSITFSNVTNTSKTLEHRKRTFDYLKFGEFDRIFFFANQNNSHWVLYEVYMKKQIINFYDSLFKHNIVAERQIKHLIEFLTFNIPLTKDCWITTVCDKCYFQNNSNDCGVFMLTFGLFLADFSQEIVKNIDCEKLGRWKIALDITRGYIEDPRLLHQKLSQNFDELGKLLFQ
jgi:hypothetical protein